MNDNDKKSIFFSGGYDTDGHCPTECRVFVTSDENYVIDWGCSGSGMYPSYGNTERISVSYFAEHSIDDFSRDYRMLSSFLERSIPPCHISTLWDVIVKDYNSRKE